jgi:hypothetical protein
MMNKKKFNLSSAKDQAKEYYTNVINGSDEHDYGYRSASKEVTKERSRLKDTLMKERGTQGSK